MAARGRGQEGYCGRMENEREEVKPNGDMQEEYCMKEHEKDLSIVRSTSGGSKKELDGYAEHEQHG